MPEFLKRGLAQSESVTREVKDTVSDILSSVQAEGESAVRRFSERFDKWSPERFTVDASDLQPAMQDAVDTEVTPLLTDIEILPQVSNLHSSGAVQLHVRTVNVRGKKRRYGRFIGKRPDRKKAYVTLKPGSKTIDFLEG